MKRTPLAEIFAVSVFLLMGIAIPPTATSQEFAPQAVARGRGLFNQSCASCHDVLGTATKSGPGLKSYYHRQGRPPDAALRVIIQQGKGTMPAFGTFNKTQLDDLLAYLKTI